MKLGQRIRRLRKERGLSLTQLGKKTGLSISFLSQLERDRVNPSLNSLTVLAEGLGTNLVDLFKEGKGFSVSVVRADERQVFHEKHLGTRLEMLTDEQPKPILPCLMTLEVGARTSGRPAIHRGKELAIGLKGTVIYHIAGEEYVLREGDSLLFDADVDHYCSNGGSEPCTWLWIAIDPTDPPEPAFG